MLGYQRTFLCLLNEQLRNATNEHILASTCVPCLRNFSLSVPHWKKRNSKHAIQQKDLTFESKRKQLPTVHIWKNMTVQDLAHSMNKSLGILLHLGFND